MHALLNRQEIRVVGLGGDLHAASQACVGQLAVDAAQRLRVRTSFLAAAAVDTRGIYVQADVERPTKLTMMDIADEVVLLVDHTKFEQSAPILLCPLERLDRLVTDRTPPPEIAKALARGDVRLEIADSGDDQDLHP